MVSPGMANSTAFAIVRNGLVMDPVFELFPDFATWNSLAEIPVAVRAQKINIIFLFMILDFLNFNCLE